jgi:FkbM family methyltransferase
MKGVIQIGAHNAEEYEGWFSQEVVNFIFFEPISHNYNKMVRILPKTNGIKTYHMALGNTTGQVMMYTEVEHQGKSCSILKPYLHLEQYPDIEFTGQELVEIDKLDNIEYDRGLYDHIHVDTQGYELEVFKGAVKSLEYIDTITTEVYRKELYKGCPMIEEVVKFLNGYGFNLKEVFWRGNSWGDASLSR